MSRRRLAFVLVAAVFVLLFGGRWFALRYTEHLWFADLGQSQRFRWLLLRSLAWQFATFAVAFAWYGAHTFAVYASIGSVHLPRRVGNIDIDEAVPSRTLRAVAFGIAALLAAVTAYTFGDLDQYIALARNAAPYGLTEPVLHRDAAFYLAVLPLLEVLHLLATVSTLLASVLVVGLYALTGSFALSRRRVRITPHARTHLVILLCALAIIVAWGFQLDAFQLVAGGGHAHGALSPGDKSVRIPASHALAAIGVVAAVGSVMALRWIRPPLLFGLWVTLGAAALLGRFVLPMLTEAWGTAGNPALVQSLSLMDDDHSRRAFGILELQGRPVPDGELSADSAGALAQAIEGVYAWSGDEGVPARLLDDLSGDTARLRRWTIAMAPMQSRGRAAPAAIAVPETDPAVLQRVVPRVPWDAWHRQRLAWGGEPVAVEAGLRAGPLRFLADLAPAESAAVGAPLRREPGRIRFLARPAEIGIVSPDENRPGDSAPGILLGGMIRRLLLAWALQAPPLLDDHTSNADRILYWRDLPARLSRLYPFAAFGTPRAALLAGRLTWIADGYLLSSRFPLAEMVRWNGEDINYLSSPYVVTVDAVDGETRFYLRPSANAFTASVARASALTPLPADSMPRALRESLLYPGELLGAQAAMLARRGDRNSGGVTWSVAWPDTTAAGHDVALLPSTRALLALDAGGVRAWQIMPIADARGDHLVALLAGAVSGSGEVELQLLTLRGDATPTPQTAAARIGASPPLVSAALSASGADGAPRRGPVYVLPAAGTVVYVQALFTSRDRADAPWRMEGLALHANGRTGFGTDVRAAVRSLQRGDAAPGALSVLAGADLSDARAAFLALDSARLAGDWERFGRAWSSLRRALHLDSAAQARP